mmetsp:Transcript_174570/g.424717  ORF Transcript_174570/g.424717 Transcript_174570/m.424717 type:complete len:213 (-) Transcript_174570:144-782(-)
MPSTTSSSSASLRPSATVMTPSRPTRCMASPISEPTVRSELAEMVATCVISSVEVISTERSRSVDSTLSTAACMPRRRSIGFMPAATLLQPSRTMARVSTVAVVVPSPAMSFVLDATWRTSCAPMFSNLSLSSMDLATVTPSLVILGAPKLCSMIALRPLGPSVTCTASASLFTPSIIWERASEPKRTSLAEKARAWTARRGAAAALGSASL